MSGKAVRETLAALGVIALLVFVGMELSQNTAAIRGQTRQALNADYLQWMMSISSSPEMLDDYNALFETNGRPDGSTMYGLMRNLENAFLQVQEGLVDESVFLSYGWNDNGVFRRPAYRDWWTRVRTRFHPNFVAAFEAEYGLAP